MTKLSRRHFLLLAAAADAGLLLRTSAADADGVGDFPLHKKVGEATSICPYCSCGCGVLVATNEEGHIVNVEGDPDHPTNRGALDPKSLAIRQMSTSPLRLKTVMYRAPNSDQWEVKTWEWATERIAQRIKQTRDETFVPHGHGGGQGRHRQPHGGYRLAGRRGQQQRGLLPGLQVLPRAGSWSG